MRLRFAAPAASITGRFTRAIQKSRSGDLAAGKEQQMYTSFKGAVIAAALIGVAFSAAPASAQRDRGHVEIQAGDLGFSIGNGHYYDHHHHRQDYTYPSDWRRYHHPRAWYRDHSQWNDRSHGDWYRN